MVAVPGQWTVQVPPIVLPSRFPLRMLRRGLRGVHLKVLLGFSVTPTTSRPERHATVKKKEEKEKSKHKDKLIEAIILDKEKAEQAVAAAQSNGAFL